MKTGSSLRNRQGGAVAVMVGISMVLLVGFLALVIDLGRLYLAKTGLQNAADAAALSGAKELDGSLTGISNAVAKAVETGELNSFFGNLGQQQVELGLGSDLTNANIWFSNSPSGPNWYHGNDSEVQSNPGDKHFIKVDTASGNLQALFAPVWAAIGGGISSMGTAGLAVAGSYPPGALTPIFVPVIRRNTNQVANTPCDGNIFNDKDYDYTKGVCPSPPPSPLTNPTNFRGPDDTPNWGFLRAGETKDFSDGSTETGSYYVIAPRANNKWQTGDPYVWQVGAAWTGNFGFMLKSDDEKTQKSIMAALCRGGGVTAYKVPGCGEVHPGQLSGPKTAANLNTRFDLQSNQTQLSHDLCPSDTNIYSPSGGAWDVNGYLTGYQAGNPLVPPTQFPPGKANRRIIRVYVVDNVWLPGYDDTSTTNDNSCTIDASKKTLTGGSESAHLVGCADFFMWKPANNQGVIYAEYVRSVPTDQCNASPATFTEIRLYR